MDFTYQETMQLINSFKQHPILYNPNILGYTNDRKSKAKAWRDISTTVGVHSEICKRKIESLMSSCRREKTKILKSRSNGNPEDFFTPKWRYWNAFKFLRGLADDQEDPLGTAPEQDIVEPKINSPWSTSKMLAHKHRKSVAPCDSSIPRTQEQPKSKQAVSPTKEDDEYSAIGVTVEAKLRKMDAKQRLYAENIINQALYKGLLFQLTSQSEIRNTDFPRTEMQQMHHIIVPNKKQKLDVSILENALQLNSGNQMEKIVIEQIGMQSQPFSKQVSEYSHNPNNRGITVSISNDDVNHSAGTEDFKSMTML